MNCVSCGYVTLNVKRYSYQTLLLYKQNKHKSNGLVGGPEYIVSHNKCPSWHETSEYVHWVAVHCTVYTVYIIHVRYSLQIPLEIASIDCCYCISIAQFVFSDCGKVNHKFL